LCYKLFLSDNETVFYFINFSLSIYYLLKSINLTARHLNISKIIHKGKETEERKAIRHTERMQFHLFSPVVLKYRNCKLEVFLVAINVFKIYLSCSVRSFSILQK